MSIATAGFVSFGEVNTPKEVIRRKSDQARKLLEAAGIELVATGPVSDDPAGADVARAVRELGRGDFDLLILCVAGWIPSHAVVSVTFVAPTRLLTSAISAGYVVVMPYFFPR